MIMQRSAVLAISLAGLFAATVGCGQAESIDLTLTTGALSGQQPFGFRHDDNFLWVDWSGPYSSRTTKVPMKPGSVPSSFNLSNGYLAVGVQGSNNHFWLYQGLSESSQSAVDSNGTMANSTSPSIAELTGGKIGFGFQGINGHLWTGVNGANSGQDSGAWMGANSSPSVAPNGTTVAIAFRGSNGHLWAGMSPTTGHDTNAWMLENPSIAAKPGGIFPVAFRGSNGNLWLLPNSQSSLLNGFDTGKPIAPGTSPAVSGDGSAGSPTYIAYNNASTGTLWICQYNLNVAVAGKKCDVDTDTRVWAFSTASPIIMPATGFVGFVAAIELWGNQELMVVTSSQLYGGEDQIAHMN